MLIFYIGYFVGPLAPWHFTSSTFHRSIIALTFYQFNISSVQYRLDILPVQHFDGPLLSWHFNSSTFRRSIPTLTFYQFNISSVHYRLNTFTSSTFRHPILPVRHYVGPLPPWHFTSSTFRRSVVALVFCQFNISSV